MELQETAGYPGNCPKPEVSPLPRKKSMRFVVSLEHSGSTGVGSSFKAKGNFVLVCFVSCTTSTNVQNSLLHAVAKTVCKRNWINARRRGLQLRMRVC